MGIAATAANEGSIRAGSTVFTQRRPRLIFQWSAPLKWSSKRVHRNFQSISPLPSPSFPSSFDQAAAYLRPSSRTRTNTHARRRTARHAAFVAVRWKSHCTVNSNPIYPSGYGITEVKDWAIRPRIWRKFDGNRTDLWESFKGKGEKEREVERWRKRNWREIRKYGANVE